jgi:hypothetical protein
MNKNILGFSILAVGFIVGMMVFGRAFYVLRSDDQTITVSGSAKKRVTSDSARWSGSFSRTVNKSELKNGYAQMKNDEQMINDFLKSQGLNESQYVISTVMVYEINNSDKKIENQINLSQSVEIKMSDMDKIQSIAKNISSLIDKGVILSSDRLEYFYSKLPEARVELLPEAIKDATERANAVAKVSNRGLGKIKTVASGVVQVLQPDSVDVSDYGSYDTATLEKDVMVTTKVIFGLN